MTRQQAVGGSATYINHLRVCLTPVRNPPTRKHTAFLEIVLVHGAAAVVIAGGLAFVGEDLFARNLVVVAANIAMLFLIRLGLGFWRQNIDYLGLSLSFNGWKPVAIGFAKLLAVLVMALAAFMFGSIVMASITGIPEQADTTGCGFMKRTPL